MTSLMDQADVVNVGALVALSVWVLLVVAGLVFAWNAPDPLAAYKDVVIWATTILLGILGTYGIIKNNKNRS